jgi:predicted RNase H-like HicB family nuclease
MCLPREAMAEAQMSVEEHLRVPYVLEMWSTETPDGDWVRHAEFPELPGCAVEAATAREAVDRLDQLRVDYILTKLGRREPVPVPRPPLRA